jgi:predicted O-methyltransferase YrrM
MSADKVPKQGADGLADIKGLLRPRRTKLTKKRYGGHNDGGYVLIEEVFNQAEVVYSYGIDDSEDSDCFDLACSDLNKKVFMFDGTINNYETKRANMFFKKENVTEDNFESHLLLQNNIEKDNMILKMDIEGCEYPVIEKNINLISKCFSMVCVEFHGLNNPEFYRYKDKGFVIRLLLENFDIFHMHANNWVERKHLIPNVIEISFVRKGFCLEELDGPYPVKGLDFPNCVGREDYKLDWWIESQFDFPNIKDIKPAQITKKIHLSWRDKNVLNGDYQLINKGARKLQLLNPDWDVVVYDDEDINGLLRDTIGKENWDLIKDKKITEKTDLWRLIKTYKEGGMYIDIDRYIDTPISEIMNTSTSMVLPTFQDVDFSQDFILTCPKNPIIGRAIVNNLNYRKKGKSLFFMAVQSYMHSVSEVLTGSKIDRGDNEEYFNKVRSGIQNCEYLETYKETGPSDHILYRNLNNNFDMNIFEKDKADFYNEENVVHWNADTRKKHESIKLQSSLEYDIKKYYSNLGENFIFEGGDNSVENEEQSKRLIKLCEEYNCKNIMEIGFNAGHSADLFLSMNNDIKLTSFDIGVHKYVDYGKKFIDNKYPGRHNLILGDSARTVKEFYKENPGIKFDLIFIDGDHSEIGAISDLFNCQKLADNKTVVVMDDTRNNHPMHSWNINVNRAWRKCISAGMIDVIDSEDYDKSDSCPRGQSWGNYIIEKDENLLVAVEQFKKMKYHWGDLVDDDSLKFISDQLEQPQLSNRSFDCYYPGGKIAVVSLYTDEIADFAHYSEKNIRQYCKKHNYTFYVYRDKIEKNSSPNWSKAGSILNHISDHEYIVWIDSDALIFDKNKKFETIIGKCAKNKYIIACEDIGKNSMLNSGVLIFKSDSYTENLIKKWRDFDGNKSSLYASGGDQEILCRILKASDGFGFNRKVFPMSEFNTDPRMIDDETFIVHFMAYPSHLKKIFIRYFVSKTIDDSVLS